MPVAVVRETTDCFLAGTVLLIVKEHYSSDESQLGQYAFDEAIRSACWGLSQTKDSPPNPGYG